MSIHDFYSSMTSGERTPLFQALYKLSRLEDLRTAMMAESTDQEMRDWSIWNNPSTIVEPTEPEPSEPMPFALARA